MPYAVKVTVGLAEGNASYHHIMINTTCDLCGIVSVHQTCQTCLLHSAVLTLLLLLFLSILLLLLLLLFYYYELSLVASNIM